MGSASLPDARPAEAARYRHLPGDISDRLVAVTDEPDDREASGSSKFLVVDDYGSGGIWFVVLADNADEIRGVLPTVDVYPPGTKPDWMSDEMLREIESRRTYRLDDLPASDWMNRLREPTQNPRGRQDPPTEP